MNSNVNVPWVEYAPVWHSYRLATDPTRRVTLMARKANAQLYRFEKRSLERGQTPADWTRQRTRLIAARQRFFGPALDEWKASLSDRFRL